MLHQWVELAATAPGAATVHQEMSGWSARDLVLADSVFRARAVGQTYDRTTGSMTPFLGTRAMPQLSVMAIDGRLREWAVGRLAEADPTPLADRLIAVRLGDHVEVVRDRAWEALVSRCHHDQAGVVAPVLVAMRDRWRTAGVLARYAAHYEATTGEPLWAALRSSIDRDTRRWAVAAALRVGGYSPAQAASALTTEPDQMVARALIDHVVATRDATLLASLVGARQARARAAALMAMPTGLPLDLLRRALLDGAGSVRAAARTTAQRYGYDAAAVYREEWEQRRSPRSLVGLIESGERPDQAWLRSLWDDPHASIRAIAIQATDPAAMPSSDVSTLFGRLCQVESARAIVRTLTRHGGWPYKQAAERWGTADGVTRRRLWRLLTSRGGWDRVRGSLLAATDDDPAVAGQGVADLRGWAQHQAAHMYRSPTPDQRDDLVRLLQIAVVDDQIRDRISFVAGLPR